MSSRLSGGGAIEPLQSESIRLSIIIPVYNSERFLGKCLDSILNQETEYVYEVICVNDGSSDCSERILKEYCERYKGVLRYVSQSNQGISAARNKGIALAKGKLIGFIDNDDYVTNDYVQKLVKRQEETDADIVQCAHAEVNLSETYKKVITKGDIIVEAADQEGKSSTVKGYIWGGVLKKSVFKDVRFPMVFWYEDMITKMLIMRYVGRIATVGKPLYYHTHHDSNATSVLWRTGDIRSVDQYWLAVLLSEFAENHFAMKPDDMLRDQIIYEWSIMLESRTRRLPENLKKVVFSLCADYLSKIGIDNFRPTLKIQREIATAYANRNYMSWKYLSRAYRLSQS